MKMVFALCVVIAAVTVGVWVYSLQPGLGTHHWGRFMWRVKDGRAVAFLDYDMAGIDLWQPLVLAVMAGAYCVICPKKEMRGFPVEMGGGGGER